ncbi:kelch-like protein 24 [Patella vulgata]|uniref:kelch-like protein 24 n=1 Tax=Patella vulgata TaxID=6465 RepID=UPI0021805A5C|nr:kelch-like protein 24 [Patella vulgata]
MAECRRMLQEHDVKQEDISFDEDSEFTGLEMDEAIEEAMPSLPIPKSAASDVTSDSDSSSVYDSSSESGNETNTMLETKGKYQTNTALCLQHGLADLYINNQMCDLDVKVDRKVFHCHRVVLSAVSNYFRTMFESGMKEANSNSITLNSISSMCFKSILDFLYCGFDIFNMDTVEEVLEASILLQMRNLEEGCIKFMASNLGTNNCLDIWKLCERHNCRDLAKKARNMALAQFEKVMTDTDLVRLEQDVLVSLLQDRDLKFSSEDVLSDAIMTWVESDPENRSGSLMMLFKYICLPEVSGEFLYKRLLHNDLIKDNPIIKQKVDDALMCHLIPTEKDNVMMKQTTLRSQGRYRRVLLVIGGNITEDDILRNVSCWDEVTECWYSLQSVPHHIGEDFASCFLDNNIYLAGGSRALDQAVWYNPQENDWHSLPNLNHGREGHSMIAVDKCIYILGGRSFKRKTTNKLVAEIERYHPGSEAWGIVGELAQPIELFAVGSVDSRIFTYGGFDENGPTTNINCFDISTKTCCIIFTMPIVERCLKSVQLQPDKVLLVSGTGNVSVHTGGDTFETCFKLQTFNRERFGLTIDGDSITVVGGIGAGVRSEKIENLCIQNKRLVSRANLYIPMDGLQAHSVVLATEHLLQHGMSIGEPDFVALNIPVSPKADMKPKRVVKRV